jgi:hypothetical protein
VQFHSFFWMFNTFWICVPEQSPLGSLRCWILFEDVFWTQSLIVAYPHLFWLSPSLKSYNETSIVYGMIISLYSPPMGYCSTSIVYSIDKCNGSRILFKWLISQKVFGIKLTIQLFADYSNYSPHFWKDYECHYFWGSVVTRNLKQHNLVFQK